MAQNITIMKKLFIILVLGTLTACKNTPTTVANPKEVTTVELQQLAKKDSTTYKVVEKDETLYVISIKDYTVVKKLDNTTGARDMFFAILIFTLFIILFILIFFGWD